MMLTVYFAHHAMYGQFGIENNRSLSARTQVLAGKLSALEAERADLKRDVALLKAPPHPDMVEEAAHRVLGYAYPHARIIALTR